MNQANGGCVPIAINPNVGPRSNVAYRDFAPATVGLHRVGDPLAAKILPVLKRLKQGREPTEQAVHDAIVAALPGYFVAVSAQAARIREGVGFAVEISADNVAGCVHGWAGASSYHVEVTGTTKGEGCLPLLGH